MELYTLDFGTTIHPNTRPQCLAGHRNLILFSTDEKKTSNMSRILENVSGEYMRDDFDGDMANRGETRLIFGYRIVFLLRVGLFCCCKRPLGPASPEFRH